MLYNENDVCINTKEKEKSMLAVNAPKKLVARIQVLVSLLLATLCLVFSLTSPLVRINFQDEATVKAVNEMLKQMNVDDLQVDKNTEGIDVSAVKMYGVVGTLIKVVKSAKSAAKSGDTSDLQNSIYESDGKTLKPGAKNSLRIAAAIASSITSDMKDVKGVGGIISMIIPIIATIALLVMAIFAPITYLIAFFAILIATLKNIKDPSAATAKVGGKLPKTVSVPIAIMLFACVTKALTPGSGAMLLFMLVLVSVLLNIVATRMHAWDQRTIRYANVVQGISIVAVVGFMVFLFNIINTTVFRTLITNDSFLKAAGTAAAATTTKAITSNSAIQSAANSTLASNQVFLPDLLMVLAAVMIVASSASYLASTLRRASLTEKAKSKDGHIVYGIILLAAVVLPMVVKGFKHDTSVEPAISYLENINGSALTGALIGVIIILVAEIALIVLKKVFCKDLSEEEMHEVLTNSATTSAERVAKAQAILDHEEKVNAKSAPAEEAAATEEAQPEATALEESKEE